MDWDKFEERFFKEEKQRKDADSRKIEKEAFDEFTADTVWKMANRGYLDYLGGVVATGKEANVFKGWDRENEVRAYKIYRMETSDFHAMWKYIEGDPRFERTRPQKRQIVLTWCRKEYGNLQAALDAGCRVPKPYYHLNNILSMQFIGDDRGAPMLKDVTLDRPEDAYWMVAKDMKNLHAANLVHGDLSEFNILWWKDEPWIIDIGQAVVLEHPNAQEFLERDCLNVAKYFTRHGVRADGKELLEYITGKH